MTYLDGEGIRRETQVLASGASEARDEVEEAAEEAGQVIRVLAVEEE